MRIYFRAGLLAAIFLLTQVFPATASSALPDEYIKYPVMVAFEDGRTGSGFYITDETGSAFFVSARHLFFYNPEKEEGRTGIKGRLALLASYPREKEARYPIRLQLELPLLRERGYLGDHPERDVMVVKVGNIAETPKGKALLFSPGVSLVAKAGEEPGDNVSLVGAQRDVIKLYSETAIGNEIFIFGYPTSLGIETYPQIDYTRPLLRKGIIAGVNDEKQSLILDCPVIYGNSGGPVVEVERVGLTGLRYSIVGMVSEFIPFDEKWYGIRQPFGLSQIENSGYSVAIPMDVILDLIRSTDQRIAEREAVARNTSD